jgi:uncharacterized membrane protein
MSITNLFLLFLIYSAIGWISEVIYCSIIERRLVNRGFLHGPVCPVYGFGALLALALLKPFMDDLAVLFVMSVVLTTALEYFSSWILETVFSMKWWDYSNFRFNINGRVCLLNSVLFGCMSVIALRFVHPWVLAGLSLFPQDVLGNIALALAVVLFVDLVLTLRTLIHINERLVALKELMEGFRENALGRDWFNELDLLGSLSRLKVLSVDDLSGTLARIASRFEAALEHTKGTLRILRAFPSMRSLRHTPQLEVFARLKDAVRMRWGVPVRARQDSDAEAQPLEASSSSGFAEGFGFYRLFWVFFTASFIGVVLELIWCVATRGRFENRSGVIYGMFNPVYGVGGLIMTLFFIRRQERRDLHVFIENVLIGGCFEYVCSLGQEMIFGSVSWDYSAMRFNIDMRTNVLYSLMWGLVGLLWVREVYPVLSRMLSRIPVRAGKALTIALFVGMIANMGVSSIAVYRWSERERDVPASSALDAKLDEWYPDAFLREKYPNMRFVPQPQSAGVSE